MTDVGLLGGTFDPVHNGHLQLAEAVLSEYRLDNILFIPAGWPPHKNSSSITDAKHRLHMLRSAIQGKPRYSVSEIELCRPEPSYTIDTLKQLQERAGGDVNFHFIIGHDAFLEIETWSRWKTLLSCLCFIIAARPGYPIDGIEELLLRNNFKPETADRGVWIKTGTTNIVRILSKNIIDVSSTKIRMRIAQKQHWLDLVPEKVGYYIQDNNLYR